MSGHLMCLIADSALLEQFASSQYQINNRLKQTPRTSVIHQLNMGQKASRPADLPYNFPYSYPEENFIDFSVYEGKKEIRLNTYMSKPDPVQFPVPRAIVYYLHGYADYVGASSSIAMQLSQSGYVVMGFDHRGFGKSEGVKGYLQNYDLYVRDVETFVGMTKSLFPDSLKTFFLAYSMGGLTAFYTALKCPGLVDGLMTYAPYLAKPADFKPMLSKAVTALGGCLRKIGKVPLAAFEMDKFTDSKDISYWWSHDPYRYQGKVRIGTGLEMFRIQDFVEKNIKSLDIPVCVLIPEKDNSVDPLKVEEIISKLAPEQHKFIKYPGCQHDFVYRVETSRKVSLDTIDWLDTKLRERSSTL